MIERNPGVTAVYTSAGWTPYRVDNGLLFDIGEPAAVSWWRKGRSATGDEVRAAIESGLPILREEATRNGTRALRLLDFEVQRAKGLIPV